MVKKTIAILLCIMLLITAMPLTVFGAEKISAKLIQMDGDVQIIRAGGEKPFKAFINMRLAEGDRIITGLSGKAKVQMDDEVIITLAENTRVYLSELRGSNGAKQSSINLQSGGVGSSVKEKLKENSRFEIKTPTAVMGVRGTEFFTQYYSGNVDVRVVDGTVEIRVNVGKDGKVTGSEEEATTTYTFPIEALQQIGFNEGEVAKGIDDKVEGLDLDGLPVPFLDRIKEIKQEAPETIPEEIMEEIDKAVENAIKKLIEKMENTDLALDEIALVLETTIAGNIQETKPTIKPPPPKSDSDSTSSRRDRDNDRGGGDTTVAVASVSINKTIANIKVGTSITLQTTVTPTNATNKTITWSSSDSNVATVDSNGKVTAKNIGIATITAKAGSKTVTCIVHVDNWERFTYDIESEENIQIDEYLDIVGGKLEIFCDEVTLTMKLRGIPDTLPYNRNEEQIKINDIEYHWGMEIDIDENTAYKLGILYVKKEGPEKNNSIEHFVEGEIWELRERRLDGGTTWHTIDDAEFEIDYSLNTIKITGIIEGLSNETMNSIEVYALDHGYGDEINVTMESGSQQETCKLTLDGEGLKIINPELEEYKLEPGFYEGIEAGTEITVKVEGEWEERLALLINDKLIDYDVNDSDWGSIGDTHVEYYTYTFEINEDKTIEAILDMYRITFDEEVKGYISDLVYDPEYDQFGVFGNDFTLSRFRIQFTAEKENYAVVGWEFNGEDPNNVVECTIENIENNVLIFSGLRTDIHITVDFYEITETVNFKIFDESDEIEDSLNIDFTESEGKYILKQEAIVPGDYNCINLTIESSNQNVATAQMDPEDTERIIITIYEKGTTVLTMTGKEYGYHDKTKEIEVVIDDQFQSYIINFGIERESESYGSVTAIVGDWIEENFVADESYTVEGSDVYGEIISGASVEAGKCIRFILELDSGYYIGNIIGDEYVDDTREPEDNTIYTKPIYKDINMEFSLIID